jgi:hypothetical protein
MGPQPMLPRCSRRLGTAAVLMDSAPAARSATVFAERRRAPTQAFACVVRPAKRSLRALRPPCFLQAGAVVREA